MDCVEGAETGIVSLLSQGGAWGTLVLFVGWWAHQQSARVKEANDALAAMQAKLTEAIEKRVQDVQLYADALKDVTRIQSDGIKEVSMSMAAVTVTLEQMRRDGYSLSRKSGPRPEEGDT